MSTFEKRRLEFGDRLRDLRERAGFTGQDFAALLGWTNSKVSKIECGRQTPTDGDLVAWLGALDVPPDDVTALRDQLRDLRIAQITWRRQLREGHRARQEDDLRSEHDASLIRAVDTAAVPGLLQTPDYARYIFRTQAELLDVPADDIADAVRTRMERQRILYDGTKTIEIITTEAALHHSVCPPNVLAGQLDRLTAAVGLPGVRFGILPLNRTLPHVLWHGYWIVDDTVYVETVSQELRIIDPEQVALYHRLTDRLWTGAMEGDDARALLARIAADLQQ